MTRKTSVALIALIYMIIGFLNFFYSLFPTLSSSGLFVIKIFSLVGGALAFYAGLIMLRFNEFGRKLVIFLLSARIIMNAVAFFQLPKEGAGLGIENNFGEMIYRVQNPYAYQGLLLILTVVAVLTITFLSHKETKEIFVPMENSDVKPDIILEE